MRPLLALVVVVLAVGMTVPWWNHNPGIAASTPRIAVAGFVTIDPIQASSLEEFRLLDALCEPLVRINPQTLAPEPALATQWRSTAEATEWTFTLRPAQWSDGSPVTAEQMAAGLQRHRDGSASGTALAAITNLATPDAATLVISCDRPQPTLLQILATPVFVPLHPAMSSPTAWTDPRRIIGNGAMRCRALAPRHHLDLVPSDTYHGPAPARGPVRLLIVDDAGTAVRLYLDGRVDAVLRLNSDTIGDLRRTDATDLSTSASWGTELYRMRVTAAKDRPLLEPRVRRALARSVDRIALVRDLLHDHGTPATTLVPLSALQLGYQPPVQVLTYDIAAAQRELVGIDTKSLLLEVVVPSNQPERLRIAEWLCDRWQRDLNLTIRVTSVPANLAQSRIKALDYDVARGSLVGDYLDPAYFLNCFTATSGMNRTGYRDATYDALVADAEKSFTDKTRTRWQLLASAEEYLLETAPIIPLFHYACAFLSKPTLTGVHANVLENVRYSAIGFNAAQAADAPTR